MGLKLAWEVEQHLLLKIEERVIGEGVAFDEAFAPVCILGHTMDFLGVARVVNDSSYCSALEEHLGLRDCPGFHKVLGNVMEQNDTMSDSNPDYHTSRYDEVKLRAMHTLVDGIQKYYVK